MDTETCLYALLMFAEEMRYLKAANEELLRINRGLALLQPPPPIVIQFPDKETRDRWLSERKSDP